MTNGTPRLIFRFAFALALFGVGYCAALHHWVDVIGCLFGVGFAWVILRDLDTRRLCDVEAAADARAVRVAKVRAAMLLDVVERDAPVAMRIGQHPPSWIIGAKWALDAARKVIREGEL